MGNADFGYARLTVERPLRRVWRADDEHLTALPDDVRAAVADLSGTTWTDEKTARAALAAAGMNTRTVTATLKTLAATDPEAQPLKAKKGGGYEPDSDLRDQENIPLPPGYLELTPEARVKAVREAAEAHLAAEIHPYAPDAWIDHDKTRLGYEIPFTRQFYVYTPPRPVAEIRAEINALEVQIQHWMKGLGT
jgi:type I restriction enzyme M protein